MPWFNIDDGFHCHPKVLALGNGAVGLWVRCGSYCASQLTDGFVPATIAKAYGTRTELKRLLDGGWLVPCENGYQMHDYLEYQRSAEQVAADRARWAERQARHRQRMSHSDTPVTNEEQSRRDSHGPSPSPSPSPSPNKPSQSVNFQDVLDAAVDRLTGKFPSNGNAARHRAAIADDIARRYGDTIHDAIRDHPNASAQFIAANLALGANVP